MTYLRGVLAFVLIIPLFAVAAPDLGKTESNKDIVPAQSDEAATLINSGWNLFLGSSGAIDEFEALRLITEGVEIARAFNDTHALSIGLNNIGVIHQCSKDIRVRDYSLGRKIVSREVANNWYSTDNTIWNVFLREEEALDQKKFLDLLKTEFKNHIVAKYIQKNKGRLPANKSEALRLLEVEGQRGDPYAAKWLALKYECGPKDIDLDRSLKWFSISVTNAKKIGLPSQFVKSVLDRKNRIEILKSQENQLR